MNPANERLSPPASLETLPGRKLLDRDFLIDLLDGNTLAPAIGAEAKVDAGSHEVIDHHEDHRADV